MQTRITPTTVIFKHNQVLNSNSLDILRVYHDTKLTSNKKMPQIVSLTASIGTGDAKDIRAIVAHYAKICANLDAKHIGHVRKNLAELRKHTPITPDSRHQTPKKIQA